MVGVIEDDVSELVWETAASTVWRSQGGDEVGVWAWGWASGKYTR